MNGAPAGLSLRDARPADAIAVAAIYAHYVAGGTASFELTPPDAAEMLRRIEAVRAGAHPWLVAEGNEVIVGYAYASPYRPRPAYRYTVEDSVYVAPGERRRGIGCALLAALIDSCTANGDLKMIAAIGDSANQGSIAVHARCGFMPVGTYGQVGYKLGQWLDVVLMQRPLGEGATTPPPPR